MINIHFSQIYKPVKSFNKMRTIIILISKIKKHSKILTKSKIKIKRKIGCLNSKIR